MAKIFHAHLHGDRVTKYNRLMESNTSNTGWTEISPQTPFYFLIPQDNQFLAEYEQGWRITDIMTAHTYGFKSHRDHFAIDFSEAVLKTRIEELMSVSFDSQVFASKYDLKKWNWQKAAKTLKFEADVWQYLKPCGYRPFDSRFMFYSDSVMDRTRPDLRKHIFQKPNLCLVCSRQVSTEKYQHVFVTDLVPNDCLISNITKESNHNFPLYLYPGTEEKALGVTRRPNFSQPFLNDLTDRLGYTPTPEAIFHYIYAIFHSPTYRSRYAEFLKIDFPRVPLTRNDALFRQLAAYGEELVALHLMKPAKLEQKSKHPQFVEQEGKCIVEPGHPKYELKTRSVIINKKGDRFTNVPEAVWNFYVGGYPVCAKWLKDRKGRTLSPQDIAHYQQIVVALGETITLMAAIDQAIPGFPIE